MMSQANLNWDLVFSNMAFEASRASKDPSTQVACLLVSPNKRRLSLGINGYPSQIEVPDDYWTDRNFKRLAVVHAEEHALLNAKTDVTGWTAYITHCPCIKCSMLLADQHLARVVYINDIKPEYKPEIGLRILAKANISVERISLV